MGSVIDYPACVNCGCESYNDYNYRTGEEFTFCANCGYNHRYQLKTRDKKITEVTKDDYEEILVDKPYGAYIIKTIDGMGEQIGTIEDEDHYNKLTSFMVTQHDKLKLFQINQYINGEIRNTVLFCSEN